MALKDNRFKHGCARRDECDWKYSWVYDVFVSCWIRNVETESASPVERVSAEKGNSEKRESENGNRSSVEQSPYP